MWWILGLAILGGIGYGAYWYYYSFFAGGNSSGSPFGGRREKRLGVLEQASVDGRRKLVLIRRDNVEHLIMTGGPVDVVVETGIEPQNARSGREEPRLEPADSGEVSFEKTSRRMAQTLEK